MKKRSLRRFLPTYQSFAYFTFSFALGVILYAAVGGPKLFDVFAALPAAFSSARGNWFPDRFERSGLLKYDPARAQPGYILYTLTSDLSAHLIDMNGREIHKWFVPFDVAAPGSSGSIKTFFGLAARQIDGGYLYPNGDILLVYEVKAAGGAVVKLDKESHVIWSYGGIWRSEVGVHHAIEVIGDRIYALTKGSQRPQQRDQQERSRRLLLSAESVTILDADGRLLSRHSITDAIASTKGMWHVLDELQSSREAGDLPHSNSLDVLTDQTARFIPGAKPGNVMLSLRNLDMLVVIDLETNKVVWALRGSWRKQHDAKMLANGHILLFDNRGDLMDHGRSRVLEIDPGTGGIVWSYGGTDSNPLDSAGNRGGAQRLSNGNTLINEANAGRILEVTPERKLVWEFVIGRQTVTRGISYIESLGLNVHRYDPSYVKFLSTDKSHVAKH